MCSIALEYLDNDEDGEVDDDEVNDALKRTAVFIYEDENAGTNA